MIVDEKREERQKEGVLKLKTNKYIGVINYAPGVGKTYTTILTIKDIDLVTTSSYLILVPNPVLQKQWETKLSILPKYLLNRIIIKTRATILAEGLSYDIGTLIVDEIHEYTTDKAETLLNKSLIKWERCIGLTGTATDPSFRRVLKYLPIVDTITSTEARDLGFIANMISYNLGLTLTPKEKEKYTAISDVISKLLPKFNNNLDLAQKMLNGGKDSNGNYYAPARWALGFAMKQGWKEGLNPSIGPHKLILENFSPQIITGNATRLINAIRKRKELLYSADAKYSASLLLMNRFNKVKTIIFSESTTFASKLGKILNENGHPTGVFHSGIKTEIRTGKTGKPVKFGQTRLKREVIEGIQSGRFRVLSTTKVFDKGLDVVDFRFALTASGTQGVTQKEQREGRPTRREVGSVIEDLPVLIVTLYIKDTQDEIWTKARESQSSIKPIYVDTIEEIDYTPPSNKEFTLLDL